MRNLKESLVCVKKYRVGLSDKAKEQLDHISSYIADELQAYQASKEVLADLKHAIASLRTFPERIPLSREDVWRQQDMHCMVVRKYLVYFQIDESKKQVNVAAILYGKRDQAAQFETISLN